MRVLRLSLLINNGLVGVNHGDASLLSASPLRYRNYVFRGFRKFHPERATRQLNFEQDLRSPRTGPVIINSSGISKLGSALEVKITVISGKCLFINAK